MVRPRAISPAGAFVVFGALLCSGVLSAEPVAVRHTEGVVHGFLVLRTLEGKPLADGDLLQTARGNRVTTRLTFHFRDGSVHDEIAVYSQRERFRLLTDHLVQKGPTFPQQIDMSIDAIRGHVAVQYVDEHGQPKTAEEHLDVSLDLANGLILTLLKNLKADALPQTVSLIAATPKPRLVKLAITATEPDRFSTGAMVRKAAHYVLKVEIGGLSGLLAPLVGKQPPDSHVWILGGPVPAFVKSEQPLYLGGPVWRIELTSPVWPHSHPAAK